MPEKYELQRNGRLQIFPISFMEDILRTVQANRQVIIKIPTWDELLSLFPEDIGYKVSGDPVSLAFNIDGTFVGQRRDGYGGIWVNGEHLRNPDRSYVTIEQFVEIAGAVYHEASRNGWPLFEKRYRQDGSIQYINNLQNPIRHYHLVMEAAGIFSVICNRADKKYNKEGKNCTLWEIVNAGKQINGIKPYRDSVKNGNPDFRYDNTGDERTRCVLEGIFHVVRNGDIAGGATFFDGADIVGNKHFTDWGVFYTSDAHDIYGTGNSIIKRTATEYKPVIKNDKVIGYQRKRKENPNIYHQTENIHGEKGEKTTILTHILDSTCAWGGTIFWKKCPIYKGITGETWDFP